jgi:hypothetical protein
VEAPRPRPATPGLLGLVVRQQRCRRPRPHHLSSLPVRARRSSR